MTGWSAGWVRGRDLAIDLGEVVGKRDTSWSVSYAPAQHPRWVVAAVVAQGGNGGSTAGPVARAVHLTLRGLG